LTIEELPFQAPMKITKNAQFYGLQAHLGVISTIILRKKNFWAIKVHTGKDTKVPDSLFSNLHNAVCSKNSIVEPSSLFLFHLWAMLCGKSYKNRVDPCRYHNIVSLFHTRYIIL